VCLYSRSDLSYRGLAKCSLERKENSSDEVPPYASRDRNLKVSKPNTEEEHKKNWEIGPC